MTTRYFRGKLRYRRCFSHLHRFVMPQHPMSAPDPSQDVPSPSVPTATAALRAQPDDASFETDFADLAARFSAQSGGGLSPELSADLALEIVLNEIVEQACLATGATGAAIVLRREGEMVCRARSGSTAPDLGARLDTSTGLSGECVRTLRTQRCNDVVADPRADIEASLRLGVRSVMVMPLLRGVELIGIFEVFSSRVGAFGERDEGNLEVLAGRALSNLERAGKQLEPHPVAVPVAEAVSDIPPDTPQDSSPRRLDVVTAFLGVAVLVCTMLLGVLVGRHLGVQRMSVRVHPAAAAAAVPASSDANASSKDEHATATAQPATGANSAVAPSTVARSAVNPSVPPGGLQVYENGKEVFRMPPAQPQVFRNQAESVPEEQGSGVTRASSVEPEKIVELSPTAAEGSLLRRVEPEYPEEARQKRVQGAVVLEVHIGADGSVQDVQVVSGEPLLARASTDAVKQWRFKSRTVNGRPAEMQTKVTLNFRLPQEN